MVSSELPSSVIMCPTYKLGLMIKMDTMTEIIYTCYFKHDLMRNLKAQGYRIHIP